MKVQFCDRQHLSLIHTDRATETGLPVNVIKALRDKLVVLEEAPDERTIRNWRSLHYEKLKGDRSGQRSIRINNQWRLVLELEETENPPIIKIIAAEDYHK